MISEENPLGILAIDHLEVCVADFNSPTKELLYTLGFKKVYKGDLCETYEQGSIIFNLNANPEAYAKKYLEKHGEGVSTLSFLVKDAEHAISEAKNRGAEVIDELKTIDSPYGTYKFASIKGVGDIRNEFIERPKSHFRPWLDKVVADSNHKPLKSAVARIDHLTNNVPYGEMDQWVKFYDDIFGMKVTRYFDIKGSKTGLYSKVVQTPNGAVIIPINEPSEENSKSQIQEFVDLHNGAGVQHIALTTTNILETIKELQSRGINFLVTPDTYYEALPDRGFSISEDIADLKELKILADGDEKGYLLQIFTENEIGPLFFEIIQRKGHDGFGEGNFQALFDAIELDQKRRGYLD
jgi:4-hydroxyphenylpyruvate dioxygenase